MDEIDLRTYIGLLFLEGVYRSRGKATSSLWDAESGRVIFRATMPLKVFHTFSRMLVKGRCPFRQYMPIKPAKYGIKIWVACDAQSSYAWKMHVYTGKPTSGGPEKNQRMRVVLDVTDGLLKRKITMVGTVRKNKPELSTVLLSTLQRNG